MKGIFTKGKTIFISMIPKFLLGVVALIKFRLGELFCGPGGLALGAVTSNVPGAKIVHEWASDIDRDSCDTYIKNICPDMPDSVICKDVRELRLAELKPIDALAFGFPCNDFSMVGKYRGISGEYGPLYKYGVEVLRLHRPLWFVAENVSGISGANDGRAFEQIKSEMADAGYILYPHLYYFERYGVPQRRHRMIIVGMRDDLPYKFHIPAPLQCGPKSCREAICEPPIPDWALNNEPRRISPRTVERLSYILPGHNCFDSDLPEHLRIKAKGAQLSSMYKRLDPNKPAYTIISSDGGGMQMYHWSEPRALTNREKARLQTFPDSYEFVGGVESVRRQVGMAVPPEGARIIFESILKTFTGTPYDHV